MPQTISTTEPFFLPGDSSKPACLLIHGFTGTPKEMRWMGEYLNGQGYACLGVRLSGHATRPKDMVRSRWTDWTASVEDGYNLLRGISDRIFLVGLSMGGVLSLLMSTRLDVKGVIAMSTPFELPAKFPAWELKIVSLVKTYISKGKGEPDEGWFDQEGFAGHISYPMNPVRSAAELQIMLERMRLVLPKINVPVLLVHSKDDKYVPSDSMQHIYDSLTTSDKQMFWVTGSGHVITRDAARVQVFEAATAFLRRVG
jgi:carboxylesterase